MRVILDTNVLVSGLLSPFGPAGRDASQMRSTRTLLTVCRVQEAARSTD